MLCSTNGRKAGATLCTILGRWLDVASRTDADKAVRGALGNALLTGFGYPGRKIDSLRNGMMRVPKMILTVDDSALIRKLLRSALAGQGYTVAEAEDGVAALEWLAANDRPDLMITDINMPRMDGFDLVETVRAQGRHNDMPILVLSTESSDEKIDRARQAGADGWIVKPFNPAQLVSAVRQATP